LTIRKIKENQTLKIPDLKHPHEALKEVEERYRRIFEASKDSLFVTSPDGTFLDVNQAGVEMLGYENKEELFKIAVGDTYFNVEDREKYQNEMRKEGCVKDFEVKLKRKDGTPIYVLNTSSARRDGSGKIIYYESIHKNITDRKRMEEALRQANDKLEQRVQERTAELSHANEMLKREIAERKRAEEQLRENEKRLQALMDASPVGISWADIEGNIKYNNRKFRELFGYTVDDIPTIAEWRRLAYLDPAQCKRLDLWWDGVMEAQKHGGWLPPLELSVTCKDGSTRDVALVGTFASNRILAIFNDLTDRKLAEEALRQSEERYRTILENIQDGYFEVDLAGNFTFVNDAECRIHGNPRDELIGMNNRQYTDKENAKKVFQAFSELYRTGEPINALDYEIIRKDGTNAFTEISVSLIRNSEGKPIGFRGVNRNVTERKQTEEALRQSEETARQLSQENAIMAEIGRIVSSTLNIEEVYERFAEEVRKLVAFDRIVINTIDIEKATVINVYMAGKQIADRKVGEVYPLKGSGNAKMVRIKSSLLVQTEDFNEYKDRFPMLLSTFQAGFQSIMNIPLFSKGRIIGGLLLRSLKPYAYTDKDVRLAERIGDQIAGAIANAQLFNERKQAEEALEKNQEELLEKNREIEASRKNLQLALEELERAYKELKATQAQILQQEKMASIGQLAAGVAHEINNPMAFISSNLGTLDKYVHRLTGFIQTQSEVIGSLKAADAIEGLKRKQKELKLDYITEDINQLITESLEGSERVQKIVQGLKRFARVDEAEYKYADINECIESTINIVWNELKYKATLKKDYGNLPLTKCYPQQMNQVFMNLLINAGHAIEKQGEITIKTWNEDGSIWVAISDTGHGIPKESLNRIFEPFFTTKEVGKGTGLGLSITYEIVQKHNGEITVESEVGKGTTFTINIPIV